MKMDIWNAVKRPPKEALKPINAGRLKGKTDINPQWRMQALTEQFGPCGIGWRYTIDRLWTESGNAEQVMAFALVSLYISKASAWSDPIPGVGGAAMIARESSGLHSNDEAYKMAVTDALSVAMKALGVAADIYAGLWDGSKYKDSAPEKIGGLTEKTVADFLAAINAETTREGVREAYERATKLAEEAKDREAYRAFQSAARTRMDAMKLGA